MVVDLPAALLPVRSILKGTRGMASKRLCLKVRSACLRGITFAGIFLNNTR
jgi:hypothetical protein